MSWKNNFPEAHTGVVIRGFRNRDGLTKTDLATKLGISLEQLQDYESGKLYVELPLRVKLGEIFLCDPIVFEES